MNKIIRKTLVLLLSIFVCFNSTMIQTHAEDGLTESQIIETGEVNETVTFSLDDQGIIYYDGEGEIDKAIEEYCENYTAVTKVYLGSSISAISDVAFTILDETVIYEVHQDNSFLFINEDGKIDFIVEENQQQNPELNAETITKPEPEIEQEPETDNNLILLGNTGNGNLLSINSNTLSISCDTENKTIKIVSNSSDNDAYMDKLASYTVVNYDNWENDQDGGEILFTDQENTSKTYHFRNDKFIGGGQIQGQNDLLELSDDKKTLTITKDAINFRAIIKNRNYNVTIKVPGYEDVTLTVSSLAVGVIEHPEVTISEDVEGNIIIWSENLEYLQTLASVNDYESIIMNSVAISLNAYSQGVPTFANFEDDYQTLFLNETEKTITINNNTLLERNIGKGEHDIMIYVDGYSTYHGTITLENACEPAPEKVSAVLDSNGNLKITSADTDWIYQLATNGLVYFIPTSSNNSLTINTDFENSFAISTDGKTALISANQILANEILNDTYTLQLHATGYESVNVTKTIKITKGCKYIDPETVNITYDENNETITVSSTNKDFISKLKTEAKYYTYTNNTEPSWIEGGYVSFYNGDDPDNELNAYFNNEIQYSDGKKSYTTNNFIAASNGLSITIPKDVIYNKTLAKGHGYSVSIHAVGYSTVYKEIDNLSIGVIDNFDNVAPITIAVTTDDNILIKSNNSEWINGIAYDLSNDGCIELYDTNGEFVAAFSNSYEYIGNAPIEVKNTGEGDYILLHKEALWEQFVPSGTYDFYIYSYGYAAFKTNGGNPIPGTAPCPTVEIVQEDEKIIIDSTNKDYLKALADEDGMSYVFFGRKDNYDIGLYYTNYEGDNSIFYDNVNEYAYVNLDDGKDYLKKNFNNTDDLMIEIYAFGYLFNNIEDFRFKYINNPGTVIKGSTKQLSFSDLDESYVTWESEDTDIATIDENGVLTAKGLGSVKIIAHYVNGSEKYDDSIVVTITPNSKVSLKIKTADGNTIANTATTEQLQVTVTGYTLTDNDTISYESDNEEIATVDENGLITFNDNDKAGVVTIKATALNDRSASIKISVYNIDKTKKLTATYTGETLEIGDEVENKINVLAGGEDLLCEPELVYSSSKDSIVSVDSNGKLTANGKGTATITVTLKDDPAKRKATCKVTVIDRVIESISEDLNVENNSAIVTDKCKNPGDNNGVRYVHVNYGLLSKNNKIHIDSTDCGIAENDQTNVTPAKVTYKSNNTSVATVDAKGYITFKKAGKVTITVTVASNPKGHEVVSRDIELEAVDYTPRIETNKFILEKYEDYSTNGYPLNNLHKILSTEEDLITNYKITETNGNDSSYFELDYDGQSGNIDTFKIKFKDSVQATIPTKSFTQLLQFSTDNGESWYKYKVTVQVKATLPTVTPKVTGYYNTFTGENTLELVNTVKNGTIDDIEFVDGWANYDDANGKITNLTTNNGKLVTSGKVRYTFVGLTGSGVVEKTIKLPTKSTKPTVKLETSTYTLYVLTGTTGNKDIVVKLIDGSKNIIKEGTVTLNNTLSITNSTLNDNDFNDKGILKVSIPVEGLKSGKIVLNYAGDGWPTSSSIPLTVNIKVATTLPKAKLSATSITLDNNFANIGTVDITIPGSSEVLTDVETEIKPSSGLAIDYENGVLSLESSSAGTYKVTCTPKIGEKELSPLTLTVKVTNTIPALKLEKNVLNFNGYYLEKIPMKYSLANNKYNVTIKSIDVINKEDASGQPVVDNGTERYINSELEDGIIKFSLGRATDYPLSNYLFEGKGKVEVVPTYKNIKGVDIDGGPVVLKINTFYTINPRVTASLKNAINPLDKNSSSLINIKLNDLNAEVTSLDMSNCEYKDLFVITKENGSFYLKIKDGADFSEYKDQTLTIKNIMVGTSADSESFTGTITLNLPIKLARKAPKVTLNKSTINIYDVTLNEDAVLGEIDLDFDDNFDIEDVDILTSNSAYKVEYDSGLKKFVVKMDDNTKIKSGSSVAFSAKLVWKNDYTNNGKYTKTTTVKFNVKDASYSIKASQ